MTDVMAERSVRVAPGADGSAVRQQFLPVILFLFIGSGCAALIYEIVWLQLLSLEIGASAISLGVLLGTFMGGMCLGSLLFPRWVSRSAHPLRVYAMLELAIGVVGLLELALVPFVSNLYVHFAATGMVSVILRAVFAGVCLLPPTILMGATLPAVARWVEATPSGVSWLGFFYGGNIIGAVVGCLTAGFYLLPQYDMRTATVCAAVINAAVAGLAFLLSMAGGTGAAAARKSETAAQERAVVADGAAGWPVYVAIGMSGLTGLGAEVVWTRLLSLMLGATVYTFSIILAVFLLGLGIGSSVGSLVARSSERPRAALAWCQFLLALAIAWAAWAVTRSIPFWPIQPGLATSPWITFQLDLARAFWAVFPGALLWGASFPLALAAIARRGQDAGKLVGGVYAANTVGAILGALAFSMVVVPALGTQGAQRVLIVLCAASCGLLLVTQKAGGGKNLLALVGAMAAAFWLTLSVAEPNWASVAWGRNSAHSIAGGSGGTDARGGYPIYPPKVTEEEMIAIQGAKARGLTGIHLVKGELVLDAADVPGGKKEEFSAWLEQVRPALTSAMKKRATVYGEGNLMSFDATRMPSVYCTFIGEGMNVSVAVTQDDWGYRYFHGAGKVQASSNPEDMRLQRMLGHLTALTKPDFKDVLVVACGAGVTAGSFVPYNSNITIVDIEPMVPSRVTPQFWRENYDVIPQEVGGRPTGYKNTKVIIDDGRHFIHTTDRKFDIITSDPIDPWVKGCAALNTVEYYQMCRDHLRPGGVVALWIPLYESSEETAKSVIATFFKVFPNGMIFSNDVNGAGYDAVLYAKVGEDGSVDKPSKIDLDAIQAYIDDPAHALVKQSLNDVRFGSGTAANGQPVAGSGEAVELFSTYAGTGVRMKGWTANTDHLINWDKNLRLQYVAGLWVNEDRAAQIFSNILTHFSYPDDIFTGSPEKIAALKRHFESSGRVERR